jgi:Legionella pneumophila major outer membrane protein precursor
MASILESMEWNMKLFKIKTAPLALALFFAGSVFAEVDNEMRTSKIESQMRDAATTNARGTYGAKLADASPNIDGYGFYVTADAIIYQLLEDNNAYATAIPSSNNGARHTYRSSFDWSWGFKTGLGYYAEHDYWQSGFEFTYLETQTSSYAPAKSGYTYSESPSIIQLQDVNTTSFTSASDKWKVHYYNLDWRIGKDFFVSKYLSFLPEIGIKSTWFYQQRNSQFNTSYFIKQFDAQDNYTGVGPKADLKAKFHFGRNFSLIGGVDVALLFASNKTSYNCNGAHTFDLVNGYTDGQFSNKLKQNHVSPFLGLNIGVAYDTNFMDDAFNFGIKVAYEQLYYNKASRILENDEASYRDISFQGVDIGLEFSF